MPQKVNFYTLFKLHPDGGIEPIRNIRIGGIQFGPGVRFGSGVSFGGVDLSKYVGHDFSVEETNGTIVIVGIY